MFEDLRGKNVLLTGGANGIGEATVEGFHQAGANVYFCDVDASSGRRLTRRLKSRIRFDVVDLEQEAEIVDWVDRIGRRIRRIHVLVNNAARDPRMALEKTSSADWDRLLALNLRSFFLTCREACKWMPRGGSIINLSSITIHTGPSAMSAYVASKGGIIGFTRSLARELGPRRIRANVVSPGWVMTSRQLREYVNQDTKRYIRASQCVPDLLQPEDIADIILFLASDRSRAMTGQELLADRGWAFS